MNIRYISSNDKFLRNSSFILLSCLTYSKLRFSVKTKRINVDCSVYISGTWTELSFPSLCSEEATQTPALHVSGDGVINNKRTDAGLILSLHCGVAPALARLYLINIFVKNLPSHSADACDTLYKRCIHD